MKLRLAPGAALLAIWIGCGGAFTTADQGAGGGGSGNVTGGSGTSGTGMGTGGAAGTEGSGGSSAGSSSVGGSGIGGTGQGGSVGVGGSSSTGGAAGRGGSSVDAGVDFTSCDGPGQCFAVDTNCCGTCGLPQASNFVGINVKHVNDYTTAKCPVALPCPACVGAKNPNIAARCGDNGHCQVIDVSKDANYSGCSADSDCHLRSGLGCCVCGAANVGWVSLNQNGEQRITKDMCAPMTGCAACVPIPPMGAAATCVNHLCATSGIATPF